MCPLSRNLLNVSSSSPSGQLVLHRPENTASEHGLANSNITDRCHVGLQGQSRQNPQIAGDGAGIDTRVGVARTSRAAGHSGSAWIQSGAGVYAPVALVLIFRPVHWFEARERPPGKRQDNSRTVQRSFPISLDLKRPKQNGHRILSPRHVAFTRKVALLGKD